MHPVTRQIVGDEDSTPVCGVPYEPPVSSSTTISYASLY
jgi:hypothetical protein